MSKYWATLKKELKVLFRDRAGMAIMFIMPMALIFIMVVVQDEPFRDYQENKIPVAIVNADRDSLGIALTRGLMQSQVFEATMIESEDIQDLKDKVLEGEYKVGIMVNDGATNILRKKIERILQSALQGVNVEGNNDSATVSLIFDPVIKKSFRSTVKNNLEKHIARIELKIMLDMFAVALKDLLPESQNIAFENEKMVHVVELDKSSNMMDRFPMLNSVQHNVPAYTIFGMFFIVITMASNIIKERDDGTELRIQLIPGSFWPVVGGKISAYLIITFIQAWLMFSVGLFILPSLGFPKLQLGGSALAINAVVIAVGMAATGFGYLVGNLFNTHQQSAVFGAVSVVIMSALGGVWVPIFVMPEFIQSISNFFPVSWGLSAINDLFLRNAGIQSILPQVLYLMVFFSICVFLALVISKRVLKSAKV